MTCPNGKQSADESGEAKTAAKTRSGSQTMACQGMPGSGKSLRTKEGAGGADAQKKGKGRRTRDKGHGTQDTGHGTRNKGHRTGDTGQRTRDGGQGTRDEHGTPDTGQGTRDTGRGPGTKDTRESGEQGRSFPIILGARAAVNCGGTSRFLWLPKFAHMELDHLDLCLSVDSFLDVLCLCNGLHRATAAPRGYQR